MLQNDTELFLLTVGDDSPEGITITEWKSSCNVDPDVEINADLRYADANRPWDIAGKSMADRVKYVQGVKKEAGKEVDEAARALKGVAVDYDPAISGFVDDLQNLGVTIVRGEDGMKLIDSVGSWNVI